jgi:hypothetical protein
LEDNGGTGPAQGIGLAPVGEGRWQRKQGRGWIQCQKCVHMYVNAIMIPVVTIPWMGSGGGV